MLNDVAGIKIQGSNFNDEIELMFFSDGKNKCSSNLLFGRNGSGKSTIAQGIRNIKNNTNQDNISCYFIDENSQKINLDEYDFKNIHIFDEKFIDENIKLAEDGLDTILLMGENVNTDIKLEQEKSRKDSTEDELKQISLEIENYLDKKNIKSHLYSEEKLFNTLKKPGNWAQKDGYFRSNKQNSVVNLKKCKELYSLCPDKSEDDLRKELTDKEEIFTKYKNNYLSTTKEVLVDERLKFDDEKIKSLVEYHIEQPILSDREKILLSLGNSRINEINNHFEKSDICPYCLQELTEEYKEDLFKSIEKILNESAEKFYQTLKNEKVSKIELNLKSYETVNFNQVNICEDKLRDFNNEVDRVNGLIEIKLENIYLDTKINSINLNSLYIEYLNSIKDLNKLIKDHNDNIENINKLRNELIEINNLLGHYQIKDEYIEYLKKLTQFEDLREKENKLKEELSNINKSINKLESEKYNYSQAMKYINNGLNYIFFSNQKLSLEYSNEKYILKSNGKSVRPGQISTGERNAMALCYFFSKLREGRDALKAFESSNLIIIDDPISSFDFENKIGILSYLKYEINNYFVENSMNKFLIMTHDLQTLFDIDKFIKEVNKNNKYLVSELTDNKIYSFNLSKRKQYSNLLKMIFDYANTDDRKKVSYLEPFIGNVMRKVMEAYSTFNYRIGFAELFCSDEILSRIDSECRNYFKTFMSRLVLNNESHYEEAISSNETNIDFFKYVSDKEKRRTAKHIMCFLYLLDENHVLNYLDGKSNAKDKINNWIKQIPKI